MALWAGAGFAAGRAAPIAAAAVFRNLPQDAFTELVTRWETGRGRVVSAIVGVGATLRTLLA